MSVERGAIDEQLLVELWPRISLPVAVVRSWHERFPRELNGNAMEA